MPSWFWQKSISHETLHYLGLAKTQMSDQIILNNAIIYLRITLIKPCVSQPSNFSISCFTDKITGPSSEMKLRCSYNETNVKKKLHPNVTSIVANIQLCTLLRKSVVGGLYSHLLQSVADLLWLFADAHILCHYSQTSCHSIMGQQNQNWKIHRKLKLKGK